jgi:hypothetical protein
VEKSNRPLDFGHFWSEVPETLHIGAYSCIFTLATRGTINLESPANWLDRGSSGAADPANCHAVGHWFELDVAGHVKFIYWRQFGATLT